MTLIYNDNDVECFIAGPDAYYEFEINAFNTGYEVFFVWEDTFEKSGLSKLPEFERSKLVPFNGVGFTNHPRGLGWEISTTLCRDSRRRYGSMARSTMTRIVTGVGPLKWHSPGRA